LEKPAPEAKLVVATSGEKASVPPTEVTQGQL
jgi:hypothetical protein